jgi:hypothetical protein
VLIENVVTVIEVGDFAPAVRWYETVLTRTADRVVADGCVEWDLSPTAKLRVRRAGNGDPPGRGPTDLIIETADVDAIIDALDGHGVHVELSMPRSLPFRTATVVDADGNRITFGQDLAVPDAAPDGDAPGW